MNGQDSEELTDHGQSALDKLIALMADLEKQDTIDEWLKSVPHQNLPQKRDKDGKPQWSGVLKATISPPDAPYNVGMFGFRARNPNRIAQVAEERLTDHLAVQRSKKLPDLFRFYNLERERSSMPPAADEWENLIATALDAQRKHAAGEPITDDEAWRILCLKMAVDYIPGFKAPTKKARTQRGRPPLSDLYLKAIHDAVVEKMGSGSGFNVSQACKFLVAKNGALYGKQLTARNVKDVYYSHLKRTRKAFNLLDLLQGLSGLKQHGRES